MRLSSTQTYIPALLAVLCLWPVFGASAAPPRTRAKPVERRGRDVLVINGAWQTLAPPSNTAQTDTWERDIPQGAKDIVVPSLLPAKTRGEADTPFWCWRRFEAPAAWKGQTVRLRFEAVAGIAQIWLNGQKLGEHQDAATPFEFTVTPALHVGASNLLALRVSGGRWGRGLWQGVLLMAHDEAYMGDCFPQSDALGHVNAALDLLNSSKNEGDSTLDARIVAPGEPARIVLKTNQNLHITPGRNSTTVLMTVSGKQRLLWSPDTPNLYLLQLDFRQGKDILDTQQVTFGLREWGWQNGAVLLNNARMPLKAVSLNEPLPRVIANADDEQRLRMILRALKEKAEASAAGKTVPLLYVYAPPPVLLRLADEEGILIIESAMPNQPDSSANEELRGLVLRDRAHVCILGWHLPGADAEAANAIRTLDATRFLIAATGADARLWPPNQSTPVSEAVPAGLLPAQRMLR